MSLRRHVLDHKFFLPSFLPEKTSRSIGNLYWPIKFVIILVMACLNFSYLFLLFLRTKLKYFQYIEANVYSDIRLRINFYLS